VGAKERVALGVPKPLPAGRVVAVAVDLDDDSLAPPEEVDLVVGVAEEEVTVDLGWRQACALTQFAKAVLEAAGGDVGSEVTMGKYAAEPANAAVSV
jgi:hypothetical protein